MSHRTPAPARKRPGPHDHNWQAYPADQRFELCAVPGCIERRYRPVAEEPQPVLISVPVQVVAAQGGINAGDHVRIKPTSQAAYPNVYWNLVGIAESVIAARTKVQRWLVDFGAHMQGRYQVREEHLEVVQTAEQQPAPAEQTEPQEETNDVDG